MLLPTPLTLLAFAMSSSTDNPPEQPSVPRIDSTETVASTRWLQLNTINYTDQEGAARKWDVVTRTTKQSSDKADAVVIIPLLKHHNVGGDAPKQQIDTLLVEQFRPRWVKSPWSFQPVSSTRAKRRSTAKVGTQYVMMQVLPCLACSAAKPSSSLYSRRYFNTRGDVRSDDAGGTPWLSSSSSLSLFSRYRGCSGVSLEVSFSWREGLNAVASARFGGRGGLKMCPFGVSMSMEAS